MANYAQPPRREPFEPALRRPLKWSVSDNSFDDKDINPKSLSVFVPIESIQDLTNHLMALMDDPSKRKRSGVWDFEKKEEVEVEGVYLNAKGKCGDYGDFGNINPKKTVTDLPF